MAASRTDAPGTRFVAHVARLVPAPYRARWLDEWQAELTWAWEHAAPGTSRLRLRATLRLRSLGALADAREMRHTYGGDRMLLRDVRLALRRLAQRPAFALLVVLTLALGIGASTAVFTIVDGLLLRPLPYRPAERLVELGLRQRLDDYGSPYLSPARLDDWRGQRRILARVAQHRSRSLVLEGDEPTMLRAELVSPDFFPILGVPARLGRTLADDEIRAGARVIVISDGLWQQAFGGARDVVGRALRLSGETYTVVGVMPPAFRYPAGTVDVWAPLPPPVVAARDTTRPDPMEALALLAPGVSRERAQAYADRVAPQVAAARGATVGYLTLRPLGGKRVNDDVRRALLVLAGAVGCVLLIACSNAANLLVVRVTGRRRELAIRRALGASRWRVMRELLAEAMVLATWSGLAGIALAYAGVRAILAVMPSQLIRFSDAPIHVDARVLAFTVAASVLTGLLFGVIPALQATGGRAPAGGGERATTGAVEQRRLRTTLVVGELALSVVLLIGAGLLVRSFVRLAAVPPGMDTTHLALLDVMPSSRRHPTDAARAAFYDAVLARVRQAPGVRAASVVSGTAGSASFSFGVRLEAEGAGVPIARQPELLPFGEADTSYFATLGIPIVRGRAFGPGDLRPHADVAIVDPDLARALWPDGQAVGRRFRVDSTGPWLTVVGVAGDVRLLGADERAGRLALYYPASPGAGGQHTIAVRTSGDPAALLPVLRAAVRAVDPLQPIVSVATGQARYHETLARPRFLLVLMATFAVVAVVLAGVGLYGVISFAVAQRTREFGVRLALGAPTRTIARGVLGEGAAMTALGVALGVAGAVAGGRVLASLLFDVAPTDVATLAGVGGGLAAVALLACWLPARRASRVPPAEALRAD